MTTDPFPKCPHAETIPEEGGARCQSCGELIPKRKRGGSKKGRRFHRVARAPGEKIQKKELYVLDSEFDFVKRVGEGSFSKGFRRIVNAAMTLASGKP